MRKPITLSQPLQSVDDEPALTLDPEAANDDFAREELRQQVEFEVVNTSDVASSIQSIARHVGRMYSDFVTHSAHLLGTTASSFDNLREQVQEGTAAVSDLSESEGELRARVQALLKTRAENHAEHEQQAATLPNKVRTHTVGIQGNPDSTVLPETPAWLEILFGMGSFGVILLLEFMLSFDLVRIGSDRLTSGAVSIGLAGILILSDWYSANRMQALQNHLNARRAFRMWSKSRAETIRDPKTGAEVSVYPLEPLFWLQFAFAHIVWVGMIAVAFWIRFSIINSQDDKNWGALMGTGVLAAVAVTYYMVNAFMRQKAVHPRLGELTYLQSELDRVQNELRLASRDQDEIAIEIHSVVAAYRQDYDLRVAQLKASSKRLATVHGTFKRLFDQFQGSRQWFRGKFAKAVELFLERIELDHASTDTSSAALDGILDEYLQADLPDAARYAEISTFELPVWIDHADGLTAKGLIDQYWPTIKAAAHRAVREATIEAARRERKQVPTI